MSDLTERLDAIQARVDAATPGPWRARTTGRAGGDHWYICDAGEAIAHISAQDGINEDQRQPDAEFIAAAPADVAFLLDLARKQGAALEALSQWADRNKTGYYDEAQDDVVQIIRPALEAKP